jgi:hypothetical protein
MAKLKISEEEAPPVISKKNSKFRYKKKKNQYERQVLGRRETSPRANGFQFRPNAGMGNQPTGMGNRPVVHQPTGMGNRPVVHQPTGMGNRPVVHQPTGMGYQQRPTQVPTKESGMDNHQGPTQVPRSQSGMGNQQRPAQAPITQPAMNRSLPNLPNHPANQNSYHCQQYYSRPVKIFFLA